MNTEIIIQGNSNIKRAYLRTTRISRRNVSDERKTSSPRALRRPSSSPLPIRSQQPAATAARPIQAVPCRKSRLFRSISDSPYQSILSSMKKYS